MYVHLQIYPLSLCMSKRMGGRPPAVSDEEILAVLRETAEPFLSTAEIAEEVPIKREGLVRRLNDLADEDQIQRKAVGNSYAWWLSEKVTVLSASELESNDRS